MKKLLGLLVAAVLLPAAANAEVLKNVELKGEIQTIASDVRHNAALEKYNSGAQTRALAGVSLDLVEDVTANLMFQYGYFWGTNNEELQGFSNGKDVKLVNANVVLHNLFCCLEATVGRQFYGDEDSAVMYIGPNHYNAETGLSYANAIDAVKLTYGDDFKTFTVLAGTVYRGYDVANSDRNTNIYGADLKLKLSDNLTAQIYGYDIYNGYDVDLTTTPPTITEGDKHTGFYGAKLGWNAEAFRMSAEYARNFGGKRLVKEHTAAGQMVKVDVAADINAVTARGTYLYANPNFEAHGNYTPGLLVGHKLGGDIYDYSDNGISMFNLGFDFKPADKWTVSLDGFTFQERRMQHSATLEADLTAKYAHNEYVELFAGVGYAKYAKNAAYNNFNKADNGSDNVKGQLGMLIKF